jgi:site-specific DNA-methyltransferase (cytosine-N4-specific)
MLESNIDDQLIHSLREVEKKSGPEFWSFQRSGMRRGAHALLHYPAMMVPDLQRTILNNICEAAPATRSVLDPFVGSGTVLIEAMQMGLDFSGLDINPLAGLACLAKAGPYHIDEFCDKRLNLVAAIKADTSIRQPREFNGRAKWFPLNIAQDLEKISAHIRNESSLWARRLFWLALCRVIRNSSNSRMSTYKLHKRAELDKSAETDPINAFERTLEVFAANLEYQHTILNEAGLLENGFYRGSLEIEVADNSILTNKSFEQKRFDVVMTSPPYGDNRTTIPYGQFAYLPLHWIDLDDIQPGIDKSLLASMQATDSASLGGSLRSAKEKIEELTEKSVSARHYIDQLGNNTNGVKRFGAFFFDFMKSVERISDRTADKGYQVWTTGNRRIGGEMVPMDDLLAELMEQNDIDVLGKIRRDIHFKKMARRNKLTDTMTAEVIVLGKKRPAE